MGDRALVQFENASMGEVSPVIYLHWGGSDVADLVSKTKAVMRDRADLAYAAARFVGVCHEHTPGNLSLGIWNQVTRLTEKDSHGDAGCFVIDCSTWRIDAFGGYGLSPSDD